MATDPIFEIGIGTADDARANAMTVLKNGNVGIGLTSPTTALEISGTISATNVLVAGTITLPMYTSAPVTCGATYKGMIAMTSTTLALCNGTNWVLDRTNATFTW